MKYVRIVLVTIILLGLCVSAPAANWSIGAVQEENSQTDIGAVQSSSGAPPAGLDIPIAMYHYLNH